MVLDLQGLYLFFFCSVCRTTWGIESKRLENDSYSVKCHVSWSGPEDVLFTLACLQSHANFQNAQVEKNTVKENSPGIRTEYGIKQSLTGK